MKDSHIRDANGHLVDLFIIVGMYSYNNKGLYVHTWADGSTMVFRNKERAEAKAADLNATQFNGINRCQVVAFRPECLQ